MREKKGESVKERLVRIEVQREEDIATNALEHQHILSGVNQCRVLLSNHLAHTDRWLWVLASTLVAAIVPYALWAAIEIIKHVWLAKAAGV
jgi:hypothetical protein